MKPEQQFQVGDLVHVAKDLGPSMSHFTADVDAIVIGSYADQYGGTNTDSYTLHLKGRGQSSWYYGKQLTLIEKNRAELLELWEKEAEEQRQVEDDLYWIFSHGEEVLKSASGATVAALAKCFGLTDLWGARGEGITYYARSLWTLQLAEPYLRARDREGYLEFCKTVEITRQ